MKLLGVSTQRFSAKSDKRESGDIFLHEMFSFLCSFLSTRFCWSSSPLRLFQPSSEKVKGKKKTIGDI